MRTTVPITAKQRRKLECPGLALESAFVDVKGGGILGHGAEQECTSRSSVLSENVRLRRASSGAVSDSEVGGAYASGESPAGRRAAACLLCLRR